MISRSIFAAAFCVVMVSGGGAVAETSSVSTAAKEAGAATSRAAGDVKTWTNKQWQSAKRGWAKDKQKWSACQSKSHQQKLEGRASWSFLYSCMTG